MLNHFEVEVQYIDLIFFLALLYQIKTFLWTNLNKFKNKKLNMKVKL